MVHTNAKYGARTKKKGRARARVVSHAAERAVVFPSVRREPAVRLEDKYLSLYRMCVRARARVSSIHIAARDVLCLFTLIIVTHASPPSM